MDTGRKNLTVLCASWVIPPTQCLLPISDLALFSPPKPPARPWLSTTLSFRDAVRLFFLYKQRFME